MVKNYFPVHSQLKRNLISYKLPPYYPHTPLSLLSTAIGSKLEFILIPFYPAAIQGDINSSSPSCYFLFGRSVMVL